MGNATDLSDDDILSILRLLPFSSLVRAGAVCNRWRRLARVADTKKHSSWCILSCPARRLSPLRLEQKQLGLSLSGPSGLGHWLSRSLSSRDGPRLSRSGSSRDRHVLSRSGSSRIPAFPEEADNYRVVMFDPFTKKWLKVANPFGHNCGGPFGSRTKELLWLPSTGGYSGLVCVVEWEEESCRRYNVYWVGNPITNKWKCIVGPSPWRGVHQLVVNPTTKTYKIVSIRWERERVRPANVPSGVWRVAIYDSAEEKWRPGATFTVPKPPPESHPKAYTLSSRTHTASDKMMYLLMYRAGKLENWETYTEVRIVGYDIESDEFKYITPFCQFDNCLKYFEPTSCRDWPVHLVLTSDQLATTGHVTSAEITQDPAHPVCPQLVTSSTSLVRPRYMFSKMFQKIRNVIQCRRGFHKEFTNKLCIMEFNRVTESWDVKEESSSQVTGKFYTKDRVFHCAGDRLEHLYCAHVNWHQSVVVWNAEKDNFSTWSRLPPLGKEYGGFVAKNYHFLGSFVPRLPSPVYGHAVTNSVGFLEACVHCSKIGLATDIASDHADPEKYQRQIRRINNLKLGWDHFTRRYVSMGSKLGWDLVKQDFTKAAHCLRLKLLNQVLLIADPIRA